MIRGVLSAAFRSVVPQAPSSWRRKSAPVFNGLHSEGINFRGRFHFPIKTYASRILAA